MTPGEPTETTDATRLAPDVSRLVGFWGRSAWLAVLLSGVATYLLLLRTLLVTQNPAFYPSMLVLGSVVVPASVLVFAATGRTRPVASTTMLTIVAISGGIFGTVAAGTLEYDTLQRLDGLPMIMVGLIEEACKLVVPVVVLLSGRVRNPAAGVVIGIASGMGFAALETMGYGFVVLLQQQSVTSLDQILLIRGLLSPAGHVAWTGIAAAALWQIPAAAGAHRSSALLRAVLRTTLVFAAVVLLHAGWDSFDTLIPRIAIGGLSFAALLVVVHWSKRATRPATPANGS